MARELDEVVEVAPEAGRELARPGQSDESDARRGVPRSGAFARSLADARTAAQLASTVEEAVARGVFGVPSFVLGEDVYFGNDRLVLLRHALLKTAGAPG